MSTSTPVRRRLRPAMPALAIGLLVAGTAAAQPASAAFDRVSVDSAGGDAAQASGQAAVSADGRHVAFVSVANDLVTSAENGRRDVFVRDRQAGVTIMVSRSQCATAPCPGGNGDSDAPAITADGRFVVFHTAASNLPAQGVDGNGRKDVYRYDRDADGDGIFDETEPGATRIELVSVGGNGDSVDPDVSDSGLRVAFQSDASNLAAAPDGNAGTGKHDIFVRDFAPGGGVTIVSRSVAGAQINNTQSVNPAISGNGEVVAFQTDARLDAARDPNTRFDVYSRHIDQEVTALVSRTGNTVGNAPSGNPAIDEDGNVIAFQSLADNLAIGAGEAALGSTAKVPDVFRRANGTTTIVSGPGGGLVAADASTDASVSAGGQKVTFVAERISLGPVDESGIPDVEIGPGRIVTRNLATGATVFEDSGANGASSEPAITADGLKVAFTSEATNLTVDGNTVADVFIRE